MGKNDIPRKVKEAVAKRDTFNGHPCCILCGKPAPTEYPLAFSNAHVVSRAQGGSMEVDNIVTLCPECHRKYDHTTEREELRKRIDAYLSAQKRKSDTTDDTTRDTTCDTTRDTIDCPYGDDFNCFTCQIEKECYEHDKH